VSDKKKVVKGLVWNSSDMYIRIILRFVATIILARYLTPEDFGLVAYILSVYVIATAVVAWGVRPYIIRSTNDTKSRFQATIVFNLMAIAATVVVMAVLYNVIFSNTEPGHVWYFIAIGVGKYLFSITSSSRALLFKELAFKRVSSANIVSHILGTVLSITALLVGAGIWSLIIFHALPEIIQSLYLMARTPKGYYKLKFRLKSLKKYLRFGKFFMSSVIISRTNRRVDSLAVRNVLGDSALGFYSQAFYISGIFSNLSTGAIANVSLSVFGKFRKKKKILSRNYLLLSSLSMRGVILLYLPFLLLTHETILVILGGRWSPIVPIAQVMVFYALLAPFKQTLVLLHRFAGDEKHVTKAFGIELSVFVVALIPGIIFYDTIGAAMAINVGLLAGLIYLIVKSRDVVNLQLKEIFINPILASVVGASVFYLVAPLFNSLGNIWLVAACSAVTMSSYLIVLIILEKDRITWAFKQLKLIKS